MGNVFRPILYFELVLHNFKVIINFHRKGAVVRTKPEFLPPVEKDKTEYYLMKLQKQGMLQNMYHCSHILDSLFYIYQRYPQKVPDQNLIT